MARMLVDRRRDSGRPSSARLPWQADDIDGITVVSDVAAPGDFIDVRVDEVVDDYDFRATLVNATSVGPLHGP